LLLRGTDPDGAGAVTFDARGVFTVGAVVFGDFDAFGDFGLSALPVGDFDFGNFSVGAFVEARGAGR
jgi:hypothetical protein